MSYRLPVFCLDCFKSHLDGECENVPEPEKKSHKTVKGAHKMTRPEEGVAYWKKRAKAAEAILAEQRERNRIRTAASRRRAKGGDGS